MIAENDQTPETLGSLIGARGEHIVWGRLGTFFLALLFSNFALEVLWEWMRNPHLFHDNPHAMFFRLALYPFVDILVYLLAFRFVDREAVAAGVAALLFTILACGIRLVLKAPGVSSTAGLARTLVGAFLWEFLVLLALIIFLRKVRPVWLALGLGLLVGGLVADALERLLYLLTGPAGRRVFFLSFREEMIGIGFDLVSAIGFAYITWAGAGVVLARTRRLPTGFFLGSLIGCPLLALAITGFGGMQMERQDTALAFAPYLLFAEILWCIYAVVLLTLIYKMWAAIQDEHARTTPGKAVGFLFIPVFNFYWVFQALWGFAQDYNRYLARHGLNLRKLPEGLFLTLAILSWIPIVSLIIGPILAAKACGAVNQLAGATSSATLPPASPA